MEERGIEIKVRHMTDGDINAVLGLGRGIVSHEDLIVLKPGSPLDFSFAAKDNSRTLG